MRGWLAGACAEPAVDRRGKEESAAGGLPRLVFLGPPEEIAEHRARNGVTSVPIACQSEGALEVYVEPVLPEPAADRHRTLAGRGRARRAGGVLGWRTAVVDDGGSAEEHPGVQHGW